MVAMASDSYLLKAPSAPCPAEAWQSIQVRSVRSSKSTSCGVIVSLVLLLGAVLGLAGLLYYTRLELCTVQGDLLTLEVRVKTLDAKLHKFVEQALNAAFDNQQQPMLHEETEEVEEEEEVDDPLDVYNPDDEDSFHVENRAHDDEDPEQEGPSLPLHPAGYDDLDNLEEAPLAFPKWPSSEPFTGDSGTSDLTRQPPPSPESTLVPTSSRPMERARREAGLPVRPEPQLRLYHMLQQPAAVAPPPREPEPWNYHAAAYRAGQQPGRPQYAYAENAPMAFVMPPRSWATSTVAPITRRRSRVMDGPAAGAAGTARRHHSGRTGRRPRQQQHQVPVQPYPHRGQDDANQRGSRSHGGSPWRGVRVTDTFHQ